MKAKRKFHVGDTVVYNLRPPDGGDKTLFGRPCVVLELSEPTPGDYGIRVEGDGAVFRYEWAFDMYEPLGGYGLKAGAQEYEEIMQAQELFLDLDKIGG